MGQFSVVLMIHNEQAGLSLSSPQLLKKSFSADAILKLGTLDSQPSALPLNYEFDDEGTTLYANNISYVLLAKNTLCC